MARLRFAEDPYSRLAIWSRRLALFSLAAALLSIIIVRSGLIEVEPGLVTFGGALVFAVLAILTAFASFVVIWRDGLRGLGYAVSAIGIGLLLLAYPTYLGIKAYQLPAIADITTDSIDPPRFEAIARLRGRTANPVQYAGLYAAEQQHDAYPDIEPLEVSVSAKTAYDTALALVNRNRWLVIDARDPQGGRRDGRIEAVARTPIMGFRDDVVIRIRGTGEEARIDMRSASRYGRHDIGTNAKRIAGFFEQIETTLDEALDRQERLERRASQQKKQVKGPQAKGQPAKNQPAAKR
jgi:uncharacterized protein (DUF1499 family)